MCGILGIIDQQDRPVEAIELERGLELLAHRGPDGQGTFFNRNFAFGHRRLAVFDLSDRGKQPLSYRATSIIFNGAIYNFPELKNELERYGHQFRSHTDTEVILAAYAEWGKACVDRFNGQWAFAIYDPLENIIFCSRDRFGIKPFYYAQFGGKFHFASEIKAFTPLKGWKKRLNRTRAYEFLVYGLQDHTVETMYEDVYQLPPGNYLTYRLADHKWEIQPYYNLPDRIKPVKESFETARERFGDLLTQSVELRLRADVAFGTALSGGLDSSSVLRIMQQLLADKPVTAVSVCFPSSPGIDESIYIDALQKERSFRSLRILPEAADFQALQEKVAWQLDEPLSSNSQVAQYLVFQRARSAGLKVMLDGQGADEILAGYPKFYAPYFKGLARNHVLQLFPAFWNFISLHDWSYRAVRKKLSVYGAKSKGLVPAWIHADWLPAPDALYRPSPVQNMRELSIQLITEMGLPALLHYEDRNAMAHGVESRLPFLDHHLVEFCLSLPDDYRIRASRRKYILREAMRPHLPDMIYRRYDKLGFAVPEWTPSQPQLQRSRAILQQLDQPVLKQSTKLAELPAPIQERIYFFSQFVQS